MPNYDAIYQAGADRLPFDENCPMEAGLIGRLSDNECKHGRLAGDRSPACGCWKGE